jgi:hypothetical protein
VPYDLRASFVSLLVWEGRTMLEVATQAGHGVDVCETYYARVFEGYDPAKRISAEAAVRAARQGQDPPWTLSGENTEASVSEPPGMARKFQESRRGDSNPRPHHYEGFRRVLGGGFGGSDCRKERGSWGGRGRRGTGQTPQKRPKPEPSPHAARGGRTPA